MELILKNRISPDKTPSEWIKTLFYAHSHGFLFTNKDATAFCCCYRIPEFDEKYTEKLPEKDEGDILYVDWAVSESKDPRSLLKMLKSYPDVNEVIYYLRGDDKKISSHKLRRKNEKQDSVGS